MISIVVALLLAFTGVLLLGPIYIGLLQRLGFGKRIRTDGPEGHQVKAGTPTMGGMLMVLVVMFLAMAMRIEDSVTLTPMLALVGVGILGAIDDYVNARTGVGMRGRWKLIWQTAVALLAAFYVQRHFNITVLNVPFLGEVVVGALFFALFMAFVIVGVSNAVNLTDGLDGLAAGVLIFSFVAYLLIALFDPPGPLEPQPNLAVFCALRHRRPDGLPVVQRPPGADLHGRLRLPGPGRHAGRGGHPEPAAAAAGDHRRRLLRGDHERGPAGRLLPAARAGASSAWHRCSTTSSWSAGRRRRSRSASGS